MSKQYASLAGNIIDLVGGPDNIATVYHCQTRLRFELRDNGKADQEKLAAVEGVAKTLVNAGVFQVVVGMHVKDVYEEVEQQLAASGHRVTETEEDGTSEKRGIVSTVIDFVAGAFQPLIPALSGAGMVKAFLALLVVFNVITRQSQSYVIINFIADAVFYFMPMLIAFSAANKLKSNPILAAGVAGIMMHPNWLALVQEGKPVHLFEVIPLPLASYAGSVIPIILVVLVQARVEKLLDRIIPAAVKLVFVPMITFLVVGTLAMTVLGPIGSIIGGWLGLFFGFLSTHAAWAPAVLIGASLPVMVMFGLHNGVAPLGIVQLAQTGRENIFGPGALVSNISVGVATLVVALRTKERKLKQIASAGSITALMGITEPALYGVLLPKRYPLIAAMIGGGCAGLYAGLTQTSRFATGSSGLPAVLLYIGDNTLQHLINIVIALVIGAIVTAVLTFALSLKYEKPATPEEGFVVDYDSLPTTASLRNGGTGTATLVRAGVTELNAPVAGVVVPLSEVGDPVFSAETMGPGIAVEPANGAIVAPCAGTVMVAMATGHAFGIRTDDGVEVLVHVGIDTVTMDGHGFTDAVQRGARIEAGQHLVTADLDAIRAAGHPTTVIMVVTNHDKFDAVTAAASGQVGSGEPVLDVVR
ncbi:beta-glucoside-specific PTS transporter subunit IIABC [Arthrobacter silvisoli]|uniref:beta-glucoside-specific PTS transporter subunit IIABC n=1 Tax=Arthrobacter silvisoli TaxID=2291022 RepID=UPI000E211E60|nr:beta-glucoside-specific PTS transporter subunit IIABC [Arthrobacter silvisoli]